MASFYSVIPGIQPSAQDILEAELLAQQILQAQFPQLDLREGTGLRDLVLRPSAMMLAIVRLGLDYYFTQNTISGVTDQTPTTIVDSILSNWFLTRNQGTYAVISARLYFARQMTVALTTDIWFSPDNTNLYYVQTATTYPSGTLQYDSFQNEYYIDVNLVAAGQGTQYNIGSGSLLYFSNFNSYFLHAEINYLVDSSIATETNTQFITRAQNAISTRNLINTPSIISNLQANFNYLNQIVPRGYGDPEMIRDEIQAVFTGQVAQLLTQLTSSGTTATATLANHGYNSGQTVTIVGAVPTIYNGNYVITVTSPSQFTYQLTTSAGAVTTLPTVQAVNSPLLIHNGGMVDIYCGNSIATSIIQLTTDQFGNATLTGAVYAFSRSSVSGGSSADTIPVNATVATTGFTVNGSAGTVLETAPNHGLATGQIVNFSGLTQTIAIQSISCTAITVTVVANSHGLTTGTSVTVQGVTPTQYNGTYTITVVDANTFTYVVSFNIQSAGSGSSMAITNPSISGNFSITVLNGNSFNVNIPKLWANGVSGGTPVITYAVPYTTTNQYTQSQPVISLTCSGTTVTATITNHGITANRYITISGAAVSGYNGTWLVTNVLSLNQLQFTVPATLANDSSTAIVCSSVIPWNDYGFSTRQSLIIGFGPNYANSTASFQISYFDTIDSVQTYLTNSTNRVLCGDLLARGFNIYLLNIGVTAYNGASPDVTAVTNAANTYLKSLSPGGIFIMSDLISQFTTSGITNIQTPVSVTYTKYTRDLVPPITGTITDALDPNDITNLFILNNVTTNNISI